MRRTFGCKCVLGSALFISTAIRAGAADVNLYGPEAGSVFVGKPMTWMAEATGEGVLRYRFRVRAPGEDYQTIRDYGPIAWLDWAAERDGLHEIEVSARNRDTGDSSTTSLSFEVESLIAAGETAVNPTDHPLVFLFSGPACADGERMRVKYQSAAGGPWQQTPSKDCGADFSMNFYLAGLHGDTAYSAHTELETGGGTKSGPQVTFETGTAPALAFAQTVLRPAPSGTVQQVLLATSGGSQIATDQSGQVIWFNPSPMTYATSVDPGGYLWGFIEDGSMPVEYQGIRKVDLVGRTVLETNAERVNEQLAAMGRRAISGFHHEVRTLPGGRIVALASVEQLLTDVQGPGTVDVLGDMIIVFDGNLQVVWTWDAFDHLDVTRMATMGEVCRPGGGGCPPFYLAPTANDWTHGNSVHPTPDGGLVFSARHQDWLIKIDYANGEGDGRVLWRLGKDGDFTFADNDPYPWFSHQHDGNFESADRIVVFDNGNARVVGAGSGNSRGQVIELDEQNRTARLVLNADLGVFAPAVGSAQRLLNGNYHFDAGYVPTPAGLTAYSLELDPSGRIVSLVKADTLIYRSIRMTDMFTPN